MANSAFLTDEELTECVQRAVRITEAGTYGWSLEVTMPMASMLVFHLIQRKQAEKKREWPDDQS